MAQIMYPDIGASFREGQAFGLQQRLIRDQEERRSGLSRLAAQAYGAAPEQRTSLLSQMAALSPQAAQDQEQQFQSADDRRNKDLVSMARLLVNAPEADRDGIYQRMRPSLSQLGLSSVPDRYGPEVADTAAKLVQAWGPAAQQETPSAIRELQLLQANPQLLALDMKRRQAGFERPQFQVDAQGQGWWLRPGQAPVQVNAAGMAAGAAGPSPSGVNDLSSPIAMPSDLSTTFASLGSAFPGTQLTSTLRSPQRNAEVGGVPNSQHLRGTAADYVVPQAQKAAFIERARSMGFEAIDEGDHVHLELPPSAQRAPAPPSAGPTFAPAGGGQVRTLSPAEVAARGYRPGSIVQVGADGKEQVVQAPPESRDASSGRPLPLGAVNKLDKDAGKLSNLQELAQRFQDQFAGNRVTGGLENIAGRLGLPGADPGQADWWQQYDRYKNEVRNELFGASLTAGEKASFEAADITPNMSPAVIRQNMKKQAEVIQKSIERQARTWAAQGYSRDAIEELTGVRVGGQGADRPAAPGSPAQQNLQPGTVMDGYRFRGGNPADQNAWEKV